MYKISLILSLAVLATLCACASPVAIHANSDDVAKAAAGIAEFALPANYAPEFTTRLGSYTAVAYNPGDGHSHLYLIQSDKEADREKLAQSLADLVPGSSDPNTRLTVVENRAAMIRGEAATVVISDGVNHDENTYRQVTVAFEGKGGPALLVLSAPSESWDQFAVDALLASIQ